MKMLKFFPILLLLGGVMSYVYASSVNFNLKDIQGNNYKLSDYKGKWVVVNYWATWCPPCVEEIPELIFFQEKNQDSVVLGVNFEDASEQKVKNFIEEHMVNYPVLLSEPGEYSDLGKIHGLPTTFIISPEGEVVVKKTGQIDATYLERTLKQLKYTLGKTS